MKSKIISLSRRLKRPVLIRVYIPLIMMVIALIVGIVGMVYQQYYVAGIGTGAVAALAILGIWKHEIKPYSNESILHKMIELSYNFSYEGGNILSVLHH